MFLSPFCLPFSGLIHDRDLPKHVITLPFLARIIGQEVGLGLKCGLLESFTGVDLPKLGEWTHFSAEVVTIYDYSLKWSAAVCKKKYTTSMKEEKPQASVWSWSVWGCYRFHQSNPGVFSRWPQTQSSKRSSLTQGEQSLPHTFLFSWVWMKQPSTTSAQGMAANLPFYELPLTLIPEATPLLRLWTLV